MNSANAKVKKDLRDAINRWRPKRRATINALKQLADKIQYRGKIANGFKLGGNAVGAVSGFVSGALGLYTIITTGGMATPFVIAGAIAAGTGVAGAVTAGGAEVTKSLILSHLLQEAQTAIKKEIDAYMTVIENLQRVFECVTDKHEIDGPDGCQHVRTGARYFCDATANLAAACSITLHSYFTKLASQAAAKAAIDAAKETVEVSTEALAKVATTAAEEATNTTAGLLLKHVYQNSTELVITAVGDTASEVVLSIGKDLSDEAVQAAVETAAINAAKSAGKSIGKESVGVAGDVLEAGGLGLIGSTSKVACKLLPLVNFGFAIWDAAQCVKAGVDIAWGSKEEKLLREKIEELNDEIERIVTEIYNPYLKN